MSIESKEKETGEIRRWFMKMFNRIRDRCLYILSWCRKKLRRFRKWLKKQ